MRVRVIDPKRPEFMQEGVIVERCDWCDADGYVAWYVRLDSGVIAHFLRDQVKKVS